MGLVRGAGERNTSATGQDAAERRQGALKAIQPKRSNDPRCRSCRGPVTGAKVYCSDRCRLVAWASRQRPHRRVVPREWEVLEPEAVPREFLVLSAARVDRALREGREVPGIKRRCEVTCHNVRGEDARAAELKAEVERAELAKRSEENREDAADAARTKALWESRTDSTGSDKGFVRIDSVTQAEVERLRVENASCIKIESLAVTNSREATLRAERAEAALRELLDCPVGGSGQRLPTPEVVARARAVLVGK